jgi:proteic killer suppression protein
MWEPFREGTVPAFQGFAGQVLRRLRYRNNAKTLAELNSRPGNRLESLSGNRAGQHSIRINLQWRVCFRWENGDAFDVEIVDYH